VVVEGFGEGDGVKDGDALPGAEGDVVDPTAVGAADLLFGPFMDEEGGFEIFCFAGGVGYAEEWVDGVAAAAVNDCAGWANEGAAEGWVWIGGLMGEEAVAPGFQELGVEVFLWGALGGLLGCEGEAGAECSGCSGGELEHLTAGVGGFGHRGNLRTIVWITNYRGGSADDNNQKQTQIAFGDDNQKGNGKGEFEGDGDCEGNGKYETLRFIQNDG
jgi:hypothetical protein